MNLEIEIQHSLSKDTQEFLTGLVNRQQEIIMADLASIKSGVEGLSDVVDSVVTLLNNLANEVRSTKPNQAALDELAASIESQKQELAEAVAANTPAEEGGGDQPHPDNTLPGDLR